MNKRFKIIVPFFSLLVECSCTRIVSVTELLAANLIRRLLHQSPAPPTETELRAGANQLCDIGGGYGVTDRTPRLLTTCSKNWAAFIFDQCGPMCIIFHKVRTRNHLWKICCNIPPPNLTFYRPTVWNSLPSALRGNSTEHNGGASWI